MTPSSASPSSASPSQKSVRFMTGSEIDCVIQEGSDLASVAVRELLDSELDFNDNCGKSSGGPSDSAAVSSSSSKKPSHVSRDSSGSADVDRNSAASAPVDKAVVLEHAIVASWCSSPTSVAKSLAIVPNSGESSAASRGEVTVPVQAASDSASSRAVGVASVVGGVGSGPDVGKDAVGRVSVGIAGGAGSCIVVDDDGARPVPKELFSVPAPELDSSIESLLISYIRRKMNFVQCSGDQFRRDLTSLRNNCIRITFSHPSIFPVSRLFGPVFIKDNSGNWSLMSCQLVIHDTFVPFSVLRGILQHGPRFNDQLDFHNVNQCMANRAMNCPNHEFLSCEEFDYIFSKRYSKVYRVLAFAVRKYCGPTCLEAPCVDDCPVWSVVGSEKYQSVVRKELESLASIRSRVEQVTLSK